MLLIFDHANTDEYQFLIRIESRILLRVRSMYLD